MSPLNHLWWIFIMLFRPTICCHLYYGDFLFSFTSSIKLTWLASIDLCHSDLLPRPLSPKWYYFLDETNQSWLLLRIDICYGDFVLIFTSSIINQADLACGYWPMPQWFVTSATLTKMVLLAKFGPHFRFWEGWTYFVELITGITLFFKCGIWRGRRDDSSESLSISVICCIHTYKLKKINMYWTKFKCVWFRSL